ncbi:MAG: hypothetical protein ACRCX2_27765, partial [Paraclostridium sp.]
MEQLNKMQSDAVLNRDGFWGLHHMKQLNPNDVYVTTACLASPINQENGELVFDELYRHFKDSLFLEIQPHPHSEQIEYNTRLWHLSKKWDLRLVAATDSHYIYPKQKVIRDMVLREKGISYGYEDETLLDYPDRKTLFNRFKAQKIFTDEEINEAIDNTLLFSETEGVYFDKEIKMPNIYKDQQNIRKDFAKVCNDNFGRLTEHLNGDQEKMLGYYNEVKREIDVFDKGDMLLYPLICHHIVKVGEGEKVEIEGKEYSLDPNDEPGLITKTGRGSGGSPLLHNLFGLTTLDRLNSEVPLLFERFISLDRLKEKVIPDLDINIVSDVPFEKAAKVILGNENAYFMYAEDTFQTRAAIKVVAKSYGKPTEIQDRLCETYETYLEKEKAKKKKAKKDGVFYKVRKIWEVEDIDDETRDIYSYAEELFGAIAGVKRHPCGLLLYDKDIEKTFGLVRMKDGSVCASTTGNAIDTFKFLKLDLLTVSTWDLIKGAYDNAGLIVPSYSEMSKEFYSPGIHEEICRIIKTGKLATVCQLNTQNGKSKAMEYCPTTIGEISDLSAAMRPGFATMISIFLARVQFAYGIPVLDALLSKTTGCRQPFVLYQEAAMLVLQKAGISLAESYNVIKAISKKKEKKIMSYKDEFIDGFIEYLMSLEETE